MRIASILKGPRRVRRVAHVARRAAEHGLGFFIARLDLQQYLPGWLRIPRRPSEARPEDLPARLASLLEELGPTFVKFGQMLATRPDILSEDYVRELERICHHVAPFSADVSRSIVREELGVPVDEAFTEFEDTPLASGSMAQVHCARLPDGTPVVVKVRRPRIERVIEDDVAILTFLAAQADKVEEFRPYRLPMLVDEFARGITGELDFVAEAAYTHRFREGLQEDEGIEVPEVFWNYTGERVLTMQCMEGIHLDELLRSSNHGADRKAIARTVLDAYLRQFFIMGIFHADPHPGNILLTDGGRVALLDFGLVGRLNARLRRNLGVCMAGLGNGQHDLVAEVLSEIGRAPDDEHTEELRQALVGLLDRYSGVPLEKMDFQRSFQEVMNIIREYRVEVPRDFVLMARALVAISGAVRQLDPELNVAAVAAPYGRRLLRERLSAAALRRDLTSGGYHLSTLLADAPADIRRLLRKMQRGLFEFRIRHEGFEKGLTELDQTGNRLSLSIILAAIIMASSQLLASGIGAVSIGESRVSALGLLGLLFGLVLGVWLIVGILRSRRL